MAAGLNRQLIRYCTIAGFGFGVDAGLLYLMTWAGGDPFVMRLLSVAVAVSLTWWLHRRWTFRGVVIRCRRSLYLLYIGVQVCGAGLSYAVFAALLSALSLTPLNSVLALCVGAFAGLILNFTGTRYVVFGACGVNHSQA